MRPRCLSLFFAGLASHATEGRLSPSRRGREPGSRERVVPLELARKLFHSIDGSDQSSTKDTWSGRDVNNIDLCPHVKDEPETIKVKAKSGMCSLQNTRTATGYIGMMFCCLLHFWPYIDRIVFARALS